MIDNFEENYEENYEELKNLLMSDNENLNQYSDILKLLGVDEEELNAKFVQKLDLEYTSDTDTDLFYSYDSDSGFDLYSSEDIVITKFGRALIPTGIKFNIPIGYEIQVRSKSGLALNQGLMVLNSPGTVDEGYTGEVKVIVFNTTEKPVPINRGMKIAQCVIASCISGKYVNLNKVESIKKKDRNENGFGSTGI
jgi:dUTP pyrophosphatase